MKSATTQCGAGFPDRRGGGEKCLMFRPPKVAADVLSPFRAACRRREGVGAQRLQRKFVRRISFMSQKLVNEVSPDLSGRNRVAHGVSRGSRSPPSPPSPLPLARARGLEGDVRAPSPRAAALGNDLTPLPGLWSGRAKRQDFVSELLTQDTGWKTEKDTKIEGTNSRIYCKQRSYLYFEAKNELVLGCKNRKKTQKNAQKLRKNAGRRAKLGDRCVSVQAFFRVQVANSCSNGAQCSLAKSASGGIGVRFS